MAIPEINGTPPIEELGLTQNVWSTFALRNFQKRYVLFFSNGYNRVGNPPPPRKKKHVSQM